MFATETECVGWLEIAYVARELFMDFPAHPRSAPSTDHWVSHKYVLHFIEALKVDRLIYLFLSKASRPVQDVFPAGFVFNIFIGVLATSAAKSVSQIVCNVVVTSNAIDLICFAARRASESLLF